MLLTCNACGAKVRAPDSAAGKRVKCPKCANIISVPAETHDDADDEATKVSPKPLPPPIPVVEDDEPERDEAATKITAAGARRPKGKTGDRDEDEDDDEELPRPRRRMDEGEDDYLNVRNQPGKPANQMAVAAMTLGIISVSMATVGYCCCGVFGEIIAIICGGLALAFGFMARGKGRSDSTAMTGIICGGIGLAIGLLVLILVLIFFGFVMAGQGGAFNFNVNG